MYNKYYDGLHDADRMRDRVWYLSVPKSYFDDGMSAGPFEFMTAISFSFEYFLTNLLFVPFMSGASFNGDLSTMSFGFSAQSDESRHMTLGLECIKFMLEQDEDNVPIVQDWIDKWFWRGYRLLGLVPACRTISCPKVMSWKEAFELYLEQQMLDGLSRIGVLRHHSADATSSRPSRRRRYCSHQVFWVLYQCSTPRRSPPPSRTTRNGLDGRAIPGDFQPALPAAVSQGPRDAQQGKRFFNGGLPMLCQVCQIPMGFTEIGNPGVQAQRHSPLRGRALQHLLRRLQMDLRSEPWKYRQAWLPVHQIFQGNCGGPTIRTCRDGTTYGPETAASTWTVARRQDWDKWHAAAGGPEMTDTTTVMQQPPTEFGEYNFPSKDRIELYGDDQLVHVFWEGNVFIAARMLRVPRRLPGPIRQGRRRAPGLKADPDYDESKVSNWRIDDTPIDPKPTDTLEELGVEHKGLLKFRCDPGKDAPGRPPVPEVADPE